MNRADFFSALRGSIFKSGLKSSHVVSIEAILDEAERRGTPLTWLAYILATARHEPGPDMEPNEENLFYTTAERIRAVWPSRFPTVASAQPFVKNPRALANKVYNGRMGNREGTDDGWITRGRGFAHLTGRDNYLKASAVTGLDLITNPDLAAELGPAVLILFDGMEGGWFTGYSLADAARVPGYVDDRKIINGSDQAALIAGYATAFESALRAGGYSAAPAPELRPMPRPAPPVVFTAEEVAFLTRLATWASQAPTADRITDLIAWRSAMPNPEAA